MTLSLAIVTRNSAQYIETLLRVGRGLADQVVVALDMSSCDATETICRKHADKLFKIEPIENPEKPLAWLNDQCDGDWILRLDDDELPSAGLVRMLPQLLCDREMTHYWLRRRWMVGPDPNQWIGQRPWWPDWQIRLFRNIPSIVRAPGTLHSSYIAQGACRYLTEASLYHFDLVYHSLEERVRKVARYRQVAPEGHLSEYYLTPDELEMRDSSVTQHSGQLSTETRVSSDSRLLTVLPIPVDDPPVREPIYKQTSKSRWPAIPTKLWRTNPQTDDFTERLVTGEELLRCSRQSYVPSPGLFRASLACINCPATMNVRKEYAVDVDVSNDGNADWPMSGGGSPEVLISYHWLRSTKETYAYEGLRTSFPHTLRPGQTTRVPARVLAPPEPGHYLLQWDLVVEFVSWFSSQGWEGPCVEVEVGH